MDVRLRHYQDVAILSVDGRVDATTAPQLAQAITAQIEAGYGRLVIDLKQVDFLNSAGIQTLLQSARLARQRQGDVRIANARAHVKYVLYLAGIDSIIQVYPHVVGATASYFSAPQPEKSTNYH